VLDAAVTLLDEPSPVGFPYVSEIAGRTGLDLMQVAKALGAMDGVYLDLRRTMGEPESWSVLNVYPNARQVVGQWPTPESLIARLVEGFNAAAEQETDPQRRKRLREVASVMGGTAKDVATEIAAKVIVHATGMG